MESFKKLVAGLIIFISSYAFAEEFSEVLIQIASFTKTFALSDLYILLKLVLLLIIINSGLKSLDTNIPFKLPKSLVELKIAKPYKKIQTIPLVTGLIIGVIQTIFMQGLLPVTINNL